MGRSLRVHPHPAGPWVVIAGARRFSVPPEIGACLLPLDRHRPDRRELAECLAATRWGPPGPALAGQLSLALEPGGERPWRLWFRAFPLWLRLPLVPGRLVARAAAPLAGLAGPRALAAMALAGGAGHLLAGLAGPHPGALGPGIALFLLTALWHELGHAAALCRAGYPPGPLGLGLLVMIPVLYVEVTAMAVLPRTGRLQISAAGPCFQLGLGGAFHLAGRCSLVPDWAGSALTLAGLSSLLAVGWSLWPFVRSDGYWMICDSLGIGNLGRPLGPGRSGLVRRSVWVFRTLNAVFLVVLGAGLPWGLARRFGKIWECRLAGSAHAAAPLAGLLVAVGLLVGVWWGIGCRVAQLLRMNKLDARISRPGSDPAGTG